jgi:hypothetical protein
VLGRVSERNPALVLPPLRQLLSELLTQIEHSSDPRCKADAARLLTSLVCSAPKLTRPYAIPILQACSGCPPPPPPPPRRPPPPPPPAPPRPPPPPPPPY